jgi:hypothetical protein
MDADRPAQQTETMRQRVDAPPSRANQQLAIISYNLSAFS